MNSTAQIFDLLLKAAVVVSAIASGGITLAGGYILLRDYLGRAQKNDGGRGGSRRGGMDDSPPEGDDPGLNLPAKYLSYGPEPTKTRAAAG